MRIVFDSLSACGNVCDTLVVVQQCQCRYLERYAAMSVSPLIAGSHSQTLLLFAVQYLAQYATLASQPPPNDYALQDAQKMLSSFGYSNQQQNTYGSMDQSYGFSQPKSGYGECRHVRCVLVGECRHARCVLVGESRHARCVLAGECRHACCVLVDECDTFAVCLLVSVDSLAVCLLVSVDTLTVCLLVSVGTFAVCLFVRFDAFVWLCAFIAEKPTFS